MCRPPCTLHCHMMHTYEMELSFVLHAKGSGQTAGAMPWLVSNQQNRAPYGMRLPLCS